MTTVRRAEVADADEMGRVHVAAAEAAYRGLMPDEQLGSLSASARAARWRNALVAGGAPGVARSEDGDAVILVAEDDAGEIVGIAGISAELGATGTPAGELRMINVFPHAWGTGAGAVLLRAAERQLQELGFDHAVLWVVEENDRARRFYEREGWTADGTVKESPRPGFVLRLVRYRRALG